MWWWVIAIPLLVFNIVFMFCGQTQGLNGFGAGFLFAAMYRNFIDAINNQEG